VVRYCEVKKVFAACLLVAVMFACLPLSVGASVTL
jgi:hypothetical protein